MVKLFSLLRKRHDLTDAQYSNHWRDVHGELAKEITRLRRYVQNRPLVTTLPILKPAQLDGIAEVWFADVAAALGMGEDPAYLDGCRQDEPNFLETDQMSFVVTSERVVFGSPPESVGETVKLLQFVKRREDLEADDFREAWAQAPGGSADQLGAIGDVTNASLPSELSAPMYWPDADGRVEGSPFDGIRELWWPDDHSFQTALADHQAWAQLLNHDLVSPERSRSLKVAEHRVIWPPPEPSERDTPRGVSP